jgi:hypothetical protein
MQIKVYFPSTETLAIGVVTGRWIDFDEFESIHIGVTESWLEAIERVYPGSYLVDEPFRPIPYLTERVQ